MHETTFRVKTKGDPMGGASFDETTGRPKSMGTQKVVFERRETITLPKLPFGSKKKKPPVARPQLMSMSSMEGQRTSALRPYMGDGAISATATNVSSFCTSQCRLITYLDVCLKP